ncbi:MAG: type III pantothenate kinase [Rikenellaceae bacterium]|jgi:type III pantothenate kinase|nr:type III pantothenate kinase [Rikenellaceae bacterium]
MNLAIDIGNSMSKAAVIDSGQVVDIYKAETFTPDNLNQLFRLYPGLTQGILISTRGDEEAWVPLLEKRLKRLVRFDENTPVPIRNGYATPKTLGRDRLAAAVGAAALHPGRASLVVDFGTAITIDLVSADGEFRGGNISPGASARFRALHEFTGRLPLGSLVEETELLATSSLSAIQSGVIGGIVFEIEGYIAKLSQEIDDFRIIFTGGDGNFFAKRLNYPIFASQDLVLFGLNKILEYNAQ